MNTMYHHDSSLRLLRAVPMCQRWQIAPLAPLKSRPVQDSLTCPDQGGPVIWMELFSTNPLELHIYIYIYIYNPNITPNLGWTNIPSCQLPIDFLPKIPPGRLVRTQLTFAAVPATSQGRYFLCLTKAGRNNGTCGRLALQAWHFPNSGLIWWGWLWILGPRRRPGEMDFQVAMGAGTCGNSAMAAKQSGLFVKENSKEDQKPSCVAVWQGGLAYFFGVQSSQSLSGKVWMSSENYFKWREGRIFWRKTCLGEKKAFPLYRELWRRHLYVGML